MEGPASPWGGRSARLSAQSTAADLTPLSAVTSLTSLAQPRHPLHPVYGPFFLLYSGLCVQANSLARGQVLTRAAPAPRVFSPGSFSSCLYPTCCTWSPQRYQHGHKRVITCRETSAQPGADPTVQVCSGLWHCMSRDQLFLCLRYSLIVSMVLFPFFCFVHVTLHNCQ